MGEHARTIGTIQFRQNMKATLRRVREDGEKFTITASNEPQAMLIPVELYSKLTDVDWVDDGNLDLPETTRRFEALEQPAEKVPAE